MNNKGIVMEAKQCEISTWQTYRKTLRKQNYSQDGGGKGWIRTTIEPTLMAHGFIRMCVDIDGDERKPRQILFEDHREIIENSSEIVYNVYEGNGHYAGFFKDMDIYYIRKDGINRPLDLFKNETKVDQST